MGAKNMRNLKDIKAIFLDVDGTLLNNKKQITDATKTIIKEIKNKLFLLQYSQTAFI